MPRAPLSFSKRYGYKSPKRILLRDDAPKSLRTAFLQITRATARGYLGAGFESEVRDLIFERLDRRVDPSPWPYESVWRQVEDAVHECFWASVYELMEAVYARFKSANPDAALVFSEQLNSSFVEKGIGWQLFDGQIQEREAD